jgi:ribitol 2-dehydrogenase
MNSALAGKVVIVTGASSGIGAAAARLLVRQGCEVVVAARNAQKLEKLAAELSPHALAVPTDVAKGHDVKQLAARTVERFGHVDVLFANAGIYIPGKVWEGDPDAWANLLDVNIDGVLRCVHAVLPHMMAQKSGDIVITSSISGLLDIEWEPIYSASKHAIHGFAHSLRRQVQGHGIRVGALAPGIVANELWGYKDPAEIEKTVNRREALRSEDVAEALIFMISRPANVTIRDLCIMPQAQDL